MVTIEPPEGMKIGGFFAWMNGEHLNKFGAFWLPKSPQELDYLNFSPGGKSAFGYLLCHECK